VNANNLAGLFSGTLVIALWSKHRPIIFFLLPYGTLYLGNEKEKKDFQKLKLKKNSNLFSQKRNSLNK
jgi:hypothetical protein